MSDDCLTVPRLRAAMAALAVAPLHDVLEPRTLALGPFWARFETPTTLLWLLADTARVEGIEDEAALQAECDVYATLLPADGVLVTLGQSDPDAARWRALLAELPTSIWLRCGDQDVAPRAVTPTGATVRIVFAIAPAMRACFADNAAVVHCHLQTFAAPLPRKLQGALCKPWEPS